jgi:hypothetical protein
MKIQNKSLLRISLIEYIPDKILSKTGKYFNSVIKEDTNSLILSDTFSKSRCIELPKTINLDPEDYVALGLYLAEGEKYTNSPGKTKHSGYVSIVNSNVKALIYYCRLLEKFNVSRRKLHFRIGVNRNLEIDEERLFSYWVNSLQLDPGMKRKKWIYYTGNPGKYRDVSTSEIGFIELYYASTVFRTFFLHFINELFQICLRFKYKNELSLILKGFFAGDGCVYYSEKNNTKMVDFSNKDSELLNKLRESLNILGLKSIRETWPERTKAHTKALRIYNMHDFKILQEYEIIDLVEYKKKIFEILMKSYENTPKTFFRVCETAPALFYNHSSFCIL